jgi:SAM-dependent methyltransferase
MLLTTCLAPLLASGLLASDPAPDLDVPYVPTPPEVVKAMLGMAKVQRGDTVYDLGSGDGRLVVTAAERFGARGLGVDIDPQRVAEARANARRAKVSGRVEFRKADLFELDLQPASVLTMYLLPDVNLKLRPRILEQLRPGARVVSHDFDMGEWTPDEQRTIGEHRVFLWIVPAKVGGTWEWTVPLTSGPRPYLAELVQRFQQVEGNVAGKTKIPLTSARLAGTQLGFTIVDPNGPEGRPLTMQYQGTVNGGSATGVVTVVEGTTSTQVPWIAKLRAP